MLHFLLGTDVQTYMLIALMNKQCFYSTIKMLYELGF